MAKEVSDKGRQMGSLGTLTDQVKDLGRISEQGLSAAQRLGRLRGILQAIRQINQSLADAGDPRALVQDICQILNEQCSYSNVWITLLDQTGNALGHYGSQNKKGKRQPRTDASLEQMPRCARRALERHQCLPQQNRAGTCNGCALSTNEQDRLARCVCLSNSNIIYGMLTVLGPGDGQAGKEEKQLLEELAANLALALHNHVAKSGEAQKNQQLRERENYLQKFFEAATEGVALAEIVYDRKGKPVDYFFRDVNPAFMAHYDAQFSQLIDRPASKFFDPNVDFHLEIYAKVAESGELTWFESYYPPLQKYFSISVFSSKRGWFTIVVDDISLKKKFISADI